ncbi:MAG: hypothetical protein HYY11_03485 [Candidatus Methylomirabilis oxyfera]|nr:hypothetical protein [Candidatus Methylomirabilis oxyfera]
MRMTILLHHWLTSSCLVTFIVLGGGVMQASAQGQPVAASIDLEGTGFHVTLPDGRVLRSPELVGAVLGLRSGLRVRIDAVEQDRDHRGRPLWLHTLSAEQVDGTWQNLCRVGPDGRRAGFAVPGHQTADGRLAEAGPGVFELTCTGGALAKCVRFGYAPWGLRPDGGAMRDLFNACVRMVRADYGGDGWGSTRDGMLIDIYDVWEIRTPDRLEEHEFEAGWTPNGAVCVHHVRVKENVSLDHLVQRYPRLSDRTGPVCTEEFARSQGALLFNRSRP